MPLTRTAAEDRISSSTPRVPTTPSETVSRDSAAIGVGRFSTAIVQAGSGSMSGTRPARRRCSWSVITLRKRGGPPPRWCTGSGTPPGSAPTLIATARKISGTSMGASLPVTPPIGPNSSPATSTRPAPMPRSARSSSAQRTEWDLLVNPISRCLTSPVPRGSGRPAVRAAAMDRSSAATGSPTALAASRARTASSNSSMRARDGSPHSGKGITSTLRRFSPEPTISACRPASASCSTVSWAARSRARSSATVASRCQISRRPWSVAAKTWDPQPTRPRRPKSQLPVDVSDVRAGHHKEIEAGGGQVGEQLPDLGGVGLPVGDGRPVPVEDDRLEPTVEQLACEPTTRGRGQQHGCHCTSSVRRAAGTNVLFRVRPVLSRAASLSCRRTTHAPNELASRTKTRTIMTTVWLLDQDALPADSPATDGDLVLRETGGEVAVGEVRSGSAVWYDERVAAALLPPGSLADAEPVGSLRRPREQEALVTAVRGVHSASMERGG